MPFHIFYMDLITVCRLFVLPIVLVNPFKDSQLRKVISVGTYSEKSKPYNYLDVQ